VRAAFGAVLFLLSIATASQADDRNRENYLLHCSGCHLPDGVGVPGTTPSLRELAPVLAAPGGRDYLGRVPGVAQASLSNVELARLLNWVLTSMSGAPPDPPYSAAEMQSLRARPIRDTAAAREALFLN
jgi:mono/diheme cytochrome c family protein